MAQIKRQRHEDGLSAQEKRANGVMLSVRLSAQESEQLQALARTNGKSVSETAREALRTGLNGAAVQVLPAGFTATINTGAPLSLFGSLSSTTTAPTTTTKLIEMPR